ncbi:enoyl-CoA delta isomerase 1, mitochondrial-like isoform X1 [Stegodyphus dumicola]|uniref:enoyl-CoA delta isomerase 1, mitochondrial-like isoform X1 n=2 Tax=Stegodyphus dumicola TaxID=202533 RepID=UPI0015A8EB41|nr:enoyl-CoA delta isomerase 1, mitochondrial-like isoform X1 [Stegodyphus dumicola]
MFSKIRPLYKCFTLLRTVNVAKMSQDSSKQFINVIEDEKKKTANVVMQRQPVNSLNLELLQQLTAAIKELEKKNYKGIILSSNSPTVFSAGLDITEMYKPNNERLRNFWISLQNMWKTLYLTPLVTIAAVNGHSPAGGCMLTLSCDHSIMVKTRATIGLNETMLGIVAPKWFRSIFINTLGFRRAEHALKLGAMFTAEQALALNIVNELVDSPSDLMSRAHDELDKWLKVPEAARQMTKISLRKPHVEELLSYEKEEVEEVVHFANLEETQKALGHYFESLKSKK